MNYTTMTRRISIALCIILSVYLLSLVSSTTHVPLTENTRAKPIAAICPARSPASRIRAILTSKDIFHMINPTSYLEISNKIGFFNAIAMGAKMAFGIQSANALIPCFKPGGIPLIPDPNLWAPCCNCFFGPFPIGCLNLMCVYFPAAIYDQTTGMCGCG